MIFKTTITDINKMAVAIDKISTMTLPNYKGLGIAIDSLTAKQAALVLSTRNLSQAELEEVVIQNDLISKYGAESLVKNGLLSSNSSLLASEKAVNAEKLKEQITQSALNKEKAEEFIQQQLIVAANGEESASIILLNKALLDKAVKKKIITEENATEILSTYGVVTADNMEIGSKKGLITSTLSLIKSKLALSALDSAAIVGVSALVFTIYKCNKAVKEAREKAQELGSSYKETSSTINDYKSKIEELYKVINDESSSIEDTTNARKSLITIQDELITKFGTEESVINNVTDAINGQTEALDKLSKAKWQEIKNEFTHGGFWNDAANFFQDTDNIERMLDEYGNKTISIKWADYADINKLTDEMVAKLENIGIDIKVSTDNLQAIRDFDSLTEYIEDTKGASLSLYGNAEEIYNKLLALQNLIGNDDSFDKLYDKVGNTADSYKELTDKYKDFYDQYILQEKIFADDSEYTDTFKNITDAAEKYNEAFTSGDETKIKEAADEYASLLSTAMTTAIANGDSDVATYFENMYPTLKSIVDGWNFNIAFDADTNDLQSKVQAVLDKCKDENGRNLTAEEILGLGEANKQYRDLVAIANNYNMSIGEMIELLKERNLVSAMDYQGLVGLFGQENIDKLSQEDLEVAYTIKNIGNMTFEQLQAEIQKTKETVTDPFHPLSITETVDQINTQLKPAFDSLKSAYQDIFTLDEDTGEKLFSLDDVDISTFESIRAELEKLGEIEGITVDYSSFEKFVSVLSSTSSTAEDVQQQFDNLATSIIYTTDCTNMSIETYDLLVKSLTEMGITNADEVLSNLRDIQEELVTLGYDVADITAQEAAELINLGTVSAETAEYLRMYLVQKELAQNPLNTLADINALEKLCNALGVTGELYKNVIALKNAFDAKERGAVSAGLDASIEYYQGKISELANGQADFKFDFSTPTTGSSKSSGSSSKSGKDATKEFDWIEQAIENVEKEVQSLDDIVNSAYSTFSQKNEALAQEISKVSDEINLQQQAYDEYMHKAESIGLPDYYKELVQSGAINIEDITDQKLQEQIDAYQKWYDKATDASNAIKELKTDMKDLYVSGYELQTDNLKERLDSNSITEKQYLEGLKTAYEQFYADLEDFAQQYHEAVLDYLDKEKEYLNDVAGAATSLLDREIDYIRDDADEQENSIKRQIDLLEARKKPLQDELDALEDKARKEELIYNLQKAQYDLERAEHQRTKLVYTEDKGMIYTSDPQAIRDAKKDVDDAKLEIQKQSIQDQIDALDDEIDRYNDLIDQINKAADDQIDALEKTKNKWQEVIDQQEEAQNMLLLTGEFGADAISKILSGNDDDLLAQWKNNYINTLADIDMESQGYIGDMTEQIASLYGVDLSPLQGQFEGVQDSISGMTDALSEAANAIGIGNNSDGVSSAQNSPEGVTLPSSDTDTGSSLEDAIKAETETAIESFDQHTDKLTNEVIPAIHAATEEMNAFNEAAGMDIEKTVTINYTVNGVNPLSGDNLGKAHAEGTVGNAFAKGTGEYRGLPHAEKNALVSEYGQTEMTVFPNGKTVITDTPTMMDLPKDTVIFNEEQTKRIMRNKVDVTSNSYAEGASDGSWIGADGHKYRPLQQGDKGWDLMKAFEPLVQKFLSGEEYIISNAVFEGQRQMEQWTKEITNNTAVNNITNNRNVQPNVNVGDIHITCPGVTSWEVMKQIKTALDNEVSGLHNYADQMSRIR